MRTVLSNLSFVGLVLTFREDSPKSRRPQHKRQSLGPGTSKVSETLFVEERKTILELLEQGTQEPAALGFESTSTVWQVSNSGQSS